MTRHMASLSGGLDSSVMALFLSGYLPGWTEPQPEMEYAFADTRMEHPNTYAMLDTLEHLAGITIQRITGPTWENALEARSWFIPWHRARWCTPTFKIRPFEAHVGADDVISYIGLRADEPERSGYLGDRGRHISPRYPLRELNITRPDVERLAHDAGLPEPARWSCSCCPFKPHALQCDMIEELPDVAEWMAWVEQQKREHGAGGYTWIRGHTMRQLIDNPTLRTEIRRRYWARHDADTQLSLFDWRAWAADDEPTPCLMCRVK